MKIITYGLKCFVFLFFENYALAQSKLSLEKQFLSKKIKLLENAEKSLAKKTKKKAPQIMKLWTLFYAI